MCGRFTLRTPSGLLVEEFQMSLPLDLKPRYNIAPTQDVVAVRVDRDTRQRQAAMLSWGLVPSWAKDVRMGARMINARSETVDSKPSFRVAFRQRRCLIIADGYYEWKRSGKSKQPFHIHLQGNGAFGMAGLWEKWKGPGRDGAETTIESCTILTTVANGRTADIHDRMPVILPPRRYDRWLDPDINEPRQLLPLLEPYDADQMAFDSVSTFVNNARNEGSRCLEKQQQLFDS